MGENDPVSPHPALYELVQLNLASMKEPIDSPAMADFVANLDCINALADRSPGFIWRPQEEEVAAAAADTPNILVNMSAWKDVAALQAYVYKSEHTEIMRRRKEWFRHVQEAYLVLWWVPAGHRPSVVEATERLDHLRRHGPTSYAFTFKNPYPPPDAAAIPG